MPASNGKALRFDIATLFPEMFPPVLNASILGRAKNSGLATYHLHDIREHADNKHGKVDDRPFGGGPGMVMACQPLHDAVKAAEALDPRPARRILFSPQGEPFSQSLAESFARPGNRFLLIAGHYEGIDERVIDVLDPTELSVGDYVLSGGELAAMVFIDALVRLLPGALGHEDSASEDSFAPRLPPEESSTDVDSGKNPDGDPGRTVRLLDCPHYTRPRVWEGREVPDVLLSGDHQAIARWRWEQMMNRTRSRRPDLL